MNFFRNIGKKIAIIWKFFMGEDYRQKFLRRIRELRKQLAEIPDAEKTNVSQIDDKTRNSTKKQIFLKLLETGIAGLIFDPRLDDVSVPEKFKGLETLTFKFSYNYHVADFDVTDEHVIASLSFQGYPFQCIVSWNAVMAIANSLERIVYVDDRIRKIEENVEPKKLEEQSPEERRKGFRLIEGGKKQMT